MTEPTPIPWRATKTGEVLAVAGGNVCFCGDADHCSPIDQANAEFIVLACNENNSLHVRISLLRNALEQITSTAKETKGVNTQDFMEHLRFQCQLAEAAWNEDVATRGVA